MAHQPYFDWMQLALDAALLPPQREQLDAHLAECAECAELWQALHGIEALFAAAPLVAPRPGFSGRFQARLQQRARPRPVWGLLALGLSVMAMAAVALPVAAGMLWSTAQIAGQPVTTAAVLSSAFALSESFLTVAGALVGAARALSQFVAGTPVGWLAVLGALTATALWVIVLRRLTLQGMVL